MTNSLLIPGSNVHVYRQVDADFLEIVCGTDVSIEILQEMIGATTQDSGRFREKRPRLKEISVTVSGANTSTNDGDISALWLLNEDNIEDQQPLQIVFEDNAGSQKVLSGTFYIERGTLTGPAEGSSLHDILFRGAGAYSITEIDNPTTGGDNVDSDTFVLSDGSFTMDANVTPIGLWQEGSNMDSLGISYSYDSGTGVMTPDPAYAIDGQKYFVIWLY